MKTAICEDELYTAEAIQQLLIEIFAEKNIISDIEIFQNGEDFLCCDEKYDLVLLDCRLPGINGVDTGIKLKEKNEDSCIIFISAYPEYAVEGYEASAIRFLVKPVRKKNLSYAIDAYINQNADECPISFNIGTKEIVLRSSEVEYIESLGKKTLIRMNDAEYTTSKTLDSFEQEISDTHFVRTHRRFIVNIACVTHYSENCLTMKNGESVEISMRKKSAFNKIYTAYLKKEF